ncbi:PKD domain-containing protein [Halochromatium glycolicum]|nr:PKD domain-containing protein [Halochromatium glycolicum]
MGRALVLIALLLAGGWSGSARAASFAVGGADGSFESDLTGTVTEGAVGLVPGIGIIGPSQGAGALLMTTEPDEGSQPADADAAELRVEGFGIPAGTGSLRLDYSFLTNEPTPSRTNDRFTVELVLITAGGEERLLAQDTFDSFYPAPWTGYAEQTGWRKLVADVSAHAGSGDSFTLALRVADTGDGRADSAVIVDNLIFADPGEPIAEVAESYLEVALGEELVLDGSGSSDADDAIAEYRWDLGNGWYGIGPVLAYTYDEEGVYRARLQVTDGDGNSSTQDVIIVVGELNSAPSIVSAPVSAAAQNVEYRYQVRVEDPELVYGDTMTFALTESPAGMIVDPATGLITWTPGDGDPRSSDVTVRVEDSEGLSDSQSFRVTIGPEVYLIAAQDDGWLYFSRSIGDGTWTAPELIDDVGNNSRGVAIADFDGDGDFDFITGNDTTNPTLYLKFYERDGLDFKAPVLIGSIGSTPFPAGNTIEDMAAGDFDNDGWMDLAVHGDDGDSWVLMNQGGLVFGEAVFFASDFETGDDTWGGQQCSTAQARDDTVLAPDGGTFSMRVYATADGSCMSTDINPSGWTLRLGSTVSFKYRIPAGVPMGLLFNVSGKGWIYLGGSPAADGGQYDYPNVPKVELIDDGQWHEVEIDLFRAIKAQWPDATTITEFEWWTGPAGEATAGQAFWFDDFEITRRDLQSGFEIARLPHTGGRGRGFDAGDVDGDGDLDLARGRCCDGLIYLYTNDGSGNFTASAGAVADAGRDPYGVMLADFDGDNAADLIGNFGSNGDSSFFKGNRSGTFQSGVAIPSLDTGTYSSFAHFDIDDDGDRDVVAATYTRDRVLYYAGNGDGTFAQAFEVGATASRTLAIALPAGREIGQPFADVVADTQAIDVSDTVQFDASGSFDDGAIGAYEWDFGDGTTGTGATPSHTYTQEGDYKAVVTVVDNEARIDRRSVRIQVTGAPPTAVAGSYVLDETMALNEQWHGFLNGGASSDDSGIVLYEWDLDASDGVDLQPLGPTPRVVYEAPGVYTVTLRVTDVVGQTATATGTVTVEAGAPPSASVTGPALLEETDASLGVWTGWYDASASSDDVGLAAISLDWGDGAGFDLAPLADDFDDGDRDGWSHFGGSWGVTHGMLTQTSLNESWVWLQDLTRRYGDFVLELDFRGSEGPSDAYVGVAFRNANSSASRDTYLLYSRDSWDFWRFYDWNTDSILAEGGSGWDPETWYRIKIEVVGERMRLWVTEAGATETLDPVLEVSDGAHAEGGIGLLTWGQAAWFDNVKVTPLDATWSESASALTDLAHSFETAGDYSVVVTAEDHAGQQHQTILDVSAVAGDAPVADAGGPYVLDEWDAWDGRWDFIGDFGGSSDDTRVERYRIDLGDGNGYTTGVADGAATGAFMTGTDLYGYDVPDATIQRIVATEDGTQVDIVDLSTLEIIASNMLDRLQSWNNVNVGDGTYFKVKASKPVVAYLTDFGAHSAFMPAMDGSAVGNEFVLHRDGNSGFYVFAFEDAVVRFFSSADVEIDRRELRAGEYWSTSSPISDTLYRVVASGRVALQTVGGNGYTTVPSENGTPVGRRFYCATVDWTTAALTAFAYDDANIEVFDLDSGELLYTAAMLAGQLWFQPGIGTRRLRIESDAAIEVWAGSTEGGSGIVDLGDDISMTVGRDGTEFLLHELRDGIVIFAPNADTAIDIDDGLQTATLERDGFLHLTPADLPPLDVHRIRTTKPVVIQTLGRANSYNDLGTYLGGVSARHWYTGVGTYDLSLVAIDNAEQESVAAFTTVQVTQGEPPVPDIAAPAEADEGTAVGGRWPVHFDATGSTDDSEIIRFQWDFGDGATATGAVVDHEYTAVGEYDVTLTTTDRAGQQTSTTRTIDVTRGAPPVADSGGPYSFGEETASHGVWTAAIDASASTDDAGIYDYLWTLEPSIVDDFTATELDGERWQRLNAAIDSGVVRVTPTGGWATTYLVTRQSYRRGPGTSFTGLIGTPTGTQNLMWGLKNLGSNASYRQFPYAIYFNNGSILIYEYGANRGTVGSYTRGQAHEVRIDLKQPSGALYYYRELGAADWTLLYDSSSFSDTYLRLGAVGNRGVFELSQFTVQQTDERPITSLSFDEPGVYELTLRVRDNALQEDIAMTSITIADGAPPTAEAGGPYEAEVGAMLTFDGSGSSDDVAIQSYDWSFGDSTGGAADLPYTGTGARARHFYRAEGTYTAELTTTDNTGKTGTDTAEVTVITGEVPSADAGGPYVGGVDGPPVYFDAMASTDDFGIVEYRWDFDTAIDSDGDGDTANDIDAVGPRPFHIYPYATGLTGLLDNFDDGALDGGLWDAARAEETGGVLSLTGNRNWGNTYAFARALRRDGQSVRGRIRVESGQTEYVVWGLKNTSDSFHYNQMPYGIYLYNGRFRVYENGTYRGAFDTYLENTWYELRVDLKPTGATYFYRADGAADWVQLYDSDYSSEAGLRAGVVVYSVSADIDDIEVVGGSNAIQARLTVEDGAGQTATATVPVTVAPNLAPDVVTVPWVAGDPLAPHETYNGKAIHLKGIVRDADPVEFEWSFGDGTGSGRIAVTDPYDLSVSHTYPDSPDNTPFTATLTVWDADGQSGQDVYRVLVKRRNLTVETNVAIDEGLWYLHRRQTRTTTEGYSSGYWQTVAYAGYSASSTAAALQAFQINGHFEHGDNATNPYAETVSRGLKYLFTLLSPNAIATQTAGEPDTNGNDIGITVNGGRPIYEGGPVMDAIAASRTPLARTVTGVDQVRRRSYFDILTDMADQFAWGQYDDERYGGWRYSWNSFPDNSAAQWGAIGLQPAEAIFGIPVPDWVKEWNDNWLSYSNNGVGFGYTGAGDGRATTPSGLVQLAFDEDVKLDPRWQAAEARVAELWSRGDTDSVIYEWSCSVRNAGTETCRDYYAMYAFVKAMRLALPEQVVTFKTTGLDWFEDADDGVARVLIDDQRADGRFQGQYRSAWDMRSAWAVIMLSRTLFVERPVADAGEDSVWAVNVPFLFDGSNSYHPDPFRSIVRYEWDFDGDGTYDHVSDQPTVEHTFDDPEAELPKTYTARLRVTDNNVPPLTATDTVEVTLSIPPRPPIADAGGTYVCTQGIPCPLDGSGSYDLDEPFDQITQYGWELDFAEFPRDFDEAGGAQAIAIFDTLGTFDVGLQVWDNGFLNDLDEDGEVDPDERKTGQDFTRVLVVANEAPTAAVAGPLTIDEGEAVELDASASTDPNGDVLSYRWDMDDDGAYDDATGATASFTGRDDGIYPVRVSVGDSLLDDTDETSVTVRNVAPVVDAGPDRVIDEGGGINVAGSYTDPGADSWIATVDYGDGSGERPLALDQATKTFALSHDYSANGRYTVTVTVTDDDGDSGSDTLGVTVTDLGPTAALSGDKAQDEGDTGSYDARASTPGPVDTITGYAWDWDYDGSFTPSGDTGATANHTWIEDGVYTVAVRVTDSDGSSDIAMLPVTVGNLAPSVDAGPDQSGAPGTTISLAPATFTDPGIQDTHTATIDWGDGSTAAPGSVTGADGSGTVSASHAFAAPGTYTVTVTVTDDEGDSGQESLSVRVKAGNLAPSADPGGPYSAPEGGSVQLDGSGSADPDNGPSALGYAWDLDGDGAFDDASGVSASLSAEDDAILDVALRVTDGELSNNAATTVTVTNVAPVVTAPDDANGLEGSALTFGAASFSDAGVLDTHVGLVNWGDGTPTEPGAVTGADGSGSFDLGSHTYVEDGSYTVTVTVTDDDAGEGSATLTATVANADPVVDAGADQATTGSTSISLAPATFTDAGTADTHTAEIDWGDGTVADGSISQGAGSGSVAGTHSYSQAGTYSVQVTVTDDDGGSGSDSFQVTVDPSVLVNQTVFDLTARVKSGKVGLSWSPVTGADGYKVYRSTAVGGPYDLLAADHGCSGVPCFYLDDGISNGVTYYYVVTSMASGVESLHSNEVSATPMERRRRRR